jgi:prephenate dehydrogenase
MTSLAGLPLAAWEGVFHSNSGEIETKLDEFRAVLDTCLRDLREGRFEELWQQAHTLQRRLSRERPGDWDANCEITVTAPDRPGTIARIAGLLGQQGIGIRDIHLLHVRERRGGTMRVVVESRADARRAVAILMGEGYRARLRD